VDIVGGLHTSRAIIPVSPGNRRSSRGRPWPRAQQAPFYLLGAPNTSFFNLQFERLDLPRANEYPLKPSRVYNHKSIKFTLYIQNEKLKTGINGYAGF
jgi:hypothetical protein